MILGSASPPHPTSFSVQGPPVTTRPVSSRPRLRSSTASVACSSDGSPRDCKGGSCRAVYPTYFPHLSITSRRRTMCARQASATSRTTARSPHQSRKELRNPWTVPPSLCRRILRVSTERASCVFRKDGKTSTLPRPSSRASSGTSNARGDNGTRCALPVFIRWPGIVQVSPSISDHVAPLASPDRTAVSAMNSTHRAGIVPSRSRVSAAADVLARDGLIVNGCRPRLR